MVAELSEHSHDAIVAAFIRDRAEQYDPSSGYHEALSRLAAKIACGEHRKAYAHGELDDLLNAETISCDAEDGD